MLCVYCCIAGISTHFQGQEIQSAIKILAGTLISKYSRENGRLRTHFLYIIYFINIYLVYIMSFFIIIFSPGDFGVFLHLQQMTTRRQCIV